MNKFITQAAKCVTNALITVLCTGSVYAACFTVYDAQSKVLYSGQNAPVDMSLQLHQTVPIAFPGGFLVFSLDGTGCQEIDTRIDAPASSLYAQAGSNQLSALDRIDNRHLGATASYEGGYNSGDHRTTAGTDVHVSGYTKANGTYVQPYTRAALGLKVEK